VFTRLDVKRFRGALLIAAALGVLLPSAGQAQERGAAALSQAVDGLGVTTRVLMIAAHPDDEDTQLISWLARGRRVETAYLSLTRGDGGQNLIGNELGEALGAIRTEELLAARRVDGGRQYFTRAFDFGFSKSAEETFRHWPEDTLLSDVVRVVRAFRPHVIVSVFSGTPRDGHGHHQVAGLIARRAYDVAADTARWPRAEYGVPWTPLKFYRAQRGNAEGASVRMNVGEFDPVLGRSFAEIAGESRSQHRSQGFGALERRGPVYTHVRREATRVPAPEDAALEESIFDGIETTWARFAAVRDPQARRLLDSVPAAIRAAQVALDLRRPAGAVPALARLFTVLEAVCPEYQTGRTSACATVTADPATGRLVRTTTDPDLERTLDVAASRARAALELAAGIVVEAEALREVTMPGAPMPVVVRFHNRGTDTVSVGAPLVVDGHEPATVVSFGSRVAPGAVRTDTVTVAPTRLTQPWWLARPRDGAMFAEPVRYSDDVHQRPAATIQVPFQVDGTAGRPLTASAPVVFRFADPVRGDVSRPLAVAPAIAVTLDRAIEMVPANTQVRRTLRVRLRSADPAERQATVRLRLPRGFAADSAARTVTLAGNGTQTLVTFAVTGRMAPGRDSLAVVVESGGETFTTGYRLVDYEHIRPLRLYRPAVLAVQAVDVRVPAGLTVGYIAGVGDNVAPALEQLGVAVTTIDPAQIGTVDLSRFRTVVVGPRAYDAHPALVQYNPRLMEWVRGGGTLVVQYGQYEMLRPGMTPFPFTIRRPHTRVTDEAAPVTVLRPDHPLLNAPNRITAADFDGWVQERALYMPATFDAAYTPLLAMNDPGEEPNQGAILVARYGRGTYVYTSLAFFRQLPAGVPGAARLFVNLLNAGNR
jgi:LmbE family N-acetylglucosaminyl deacetylase